MTVAGWGHSAKFHQRMMDEFSSKLDLNAEQKEKGSAILEGKRAKMDSLRKEMRPKFDEIRSATKAEIRSARN